MDWGELRPPNFVKLSYTSMIQIILVIRIISHHHVPNALLPLLKLAPPTAYASAPSTYMNTIDTEQLGFSLPLRPVVAETPPDDAFSREKHV